MKKFIASGRIGREVSDALCISRNNLEILEAERDSRKTNEIKSLSREFEMLLA